MIFSEQLDKNTDLEGVYVCESQQLNSTDSTVLKLTCRSPAAHRTRL